MSAAAEEAKNLVHNLDARIGPLVLNVQAAVKDAQKPLQNIGGQVEPLGPSIQKALDGIDIQPGGTDRRDNALVLGVQLGINF